MNAWRKSSIRSKVEHLLLIVKRDFGCRKVECRGLTKTQAVEDDVIRGGSRPFYNTGGRGRRNTWGFVSLLQHRWPRTTALRK